ncbi:DUF523 and DUF1722 domain-containing protein [Desulfovibrio sulfodismutans]|uniref:DUF523 and DUF1722 domain-containing protein n=1 Tax=Desulfolutivibrio sulfodismutans TaxID=63561 RepID=A0A7K3NRN2_9BACT|nr:DUF523 and DUF1722 domain-containing protein [Desulfolutivibrio sulfodismutans]NDY58483.1 DUF523 and DUF1722 domain-containing protein [Desulfolutivibrio sulfodismutans]QLA10778.1 DUF1722 domain-containing protein [Desulfolutivibrio sulfodismutans DSM 3696]
MDRPIRLGVSACLLGHNVRYDGGHKRDAYVADTLSAYFDFVPVCPETECGLPVPRPAMRLTGDPASPRLVTITTGIDVTGRMLDYCARRVEELAGENLCGYIFKSKSPSSGMARVKVYPEKGPPAMTGVGLFARAFMDRFPLLPVEEEGRLHDAGLRENFIERVFTLARYRDLLAEVGLDATPSGAPTPDAPGKSLRVGRLAAFQASHKYLLMSHSPKIAGQMGRLAARARAVPDAELFPQYQRLLLSAMALHATPAKHANVLQHILGYFKKQLSPDEKAEALELFADYRAGQLPLVVPVTLLSHFVRKYDAAYLKDQWYLHPHPRELMLRNHA